MNGGWQIKKLGEVAEISAGNSAPQDAALFKDGNHPFFRTSDVGSIRFGDITIAADYLNDEGIKKLRKYPSGTILFPKSGASTFLNHRVMMKVDGYVSSHLATIVADSKKADSRFLLFFLSTVAAQDLIQDHSYPSLNLPLIAGISIPVPPLPEQQRIVAVLDEAFGGIAKATENAQKNLANARELFESHLQSIFTTKGDGWVEKTLDTIAEFSQGIQVGLEKQSTQPSDGLVRFIRIVDYTQRTDDIRYIQNPGERYWANESDLVMVRYGTPGLVGRGIAGVIANNLFKITIAPNTVSNDFMGYFFAQPTIREYLGSQGSSTMPALTFKQLGQVMVSFPSSEDEQQRIVAQLDTLATETKRLEAIYQQKLEHLAALKQSILQKAFAGELQLDRLAA